MNNDKTLMTVVVSSFIHEIQLAQAKLESKGIRSFIVDENLNSIIGTSFIEGYKLNVSDTDFEQARTILSLSRT